MDYNSRLSVIEDKGECGDPEIFDSADKVQKTVKRLVSLIQGSKKIVAFTGAGISTSCGIPDFRGPNGVWTKELRGEVAEINSAAPNLFDTARPSFTHYALTCLLHLGIISHIASQNVDSLHIRSGVPEYQLSEIHGNIFKEKCSVCGKEYLRDFDVGGMGLKPTGRLCDTDNCQGILCDMAYDWKTTLNDDLFLRVENELDAADIILSMGTSLRVEPANLLPRRLRLYNKARSWGKGKIVIVNLQKTNLDHLADIRIFSYCDYVMSLLCEALGVTLVDPAHRQGDDVKAWYVVDKGSVVEEMLRRRQEESEKEQRPVRVTKPRDILTADIPLATKKSKVSSSTGNVQKTPSRNSSGAVKSSTSARAGPQSDSDRGSAAPSKSTTSKKKATRVTAAVAETTASSVTAKISAASSATSRKLPPYTVESAPKYLSFGEVLDRNEHKFDLNNFQLPPSVFKDVGSGGSDA